MAVSDIPLDRIVNTRTSWSQYLWRLPVADPSYRWDDRIEYMYSIMATPVEGQGLPLFPPAPPLDSPFSSGQVRWLDGRYVRSVNGQAPDEKGNVALDLSALKIPVIISQDSQSAYETDANTIGLFHLDGNGLDSSGLNNHATEPSYSVPQYSPQSAKFGAAGLSRPALVLPDALRTFFAGAVTPSYTSEAWVKSSTKQLQVAVGQAAGHYLAMDASGFGWAAYQSNGDTKPMVSTVRIDDGAWHHMALVVTSGAGAVLYIDGKVAVTSTTPGNNVGTTNPFTIGSMGNAYFWSGSVDEVRISKIARNSFGGYPKRPSGVPAGYATYIGSATPSDMLKGDAWRKVS